MTQPPQQPPRRHSLEDYFKFDRNSLTRNEYRDGEILDMSGGSLEHSLIIANTIRALGNRLERSPCRVYDSNLRVRIARKLRYAYPDATVICHAPEFDPDDSSRTTIINPRVIVEVLSASTEQYDRGDKFRPYLEVESLQEYVMISQDEPRVETVFRQPDGTWAIAPATGLDSIALLRSLKAELPLAELYAGVTFSPEDDAGARER
jgi:Uma2 family endonuclease